MYEKALITGTGEILKVFPMLIKKNKTNVNPNGGGNLGRPVQLYTCKHFDTESRLCKDYENRPPMCRKFPLKEEGCKYSGCSITCQGNKKNM